MNEKNHRGKSWDDVWLAFEVFFLKNKNFKLKLFFFFFWSFSLFGKGRNLFHLNSPPTRLTETEINFFSCAQGKLRHLAFRSGKSIEKNVINSRKMFARLRLTFSQYFMCIFKGELSYCHPSRAVNSAKKLNKK